MKIAILLTSGFEEAEALFPTDIFRRANIKTDLVSISAKKGNELWVVKQAIELRLKNDIIYWGR